MKSIFLNSKSLLKQLLFGCGFCCSAPHFVLANGTIFRYRVPVTRSRNETRTIAVLGIKTEAHAAQPAFYVPGYLQTAGFEIIPVRIYYQDTTQTLGQPI